MQTLIDATLELLDSPLTNRLLLIMYCLNSGLFAGMMLGDLKMKPCKL